LLGTDDVDLRLLEGGVELIELGRVEVELVQCEGDFLGVELAGRGLPPLPGPAPCRSDQLRSELPLSFDRNDVTVAVGQARRQKSRSAEIKSLPP
jgi:hypothetical protein